MFRTMLILAGVSSLAVAASAQQTTPPAGNGIEGGEIIVLSNWNYEQLYQDGTSVQQMFGLPVYGANGEQIGDVEDLVIGSDGQVKAAIAEIGGILDIGDTHVAVAWDQVEFSGGGLATPLTDDTIGDFDVFAFADPQMLRDGVVAGVDGEDLGPANWRASELIGDYVRLRGSDGAALVNYGLVNDLVIAGGEVQATIVSAGPMYGRGAYAFPYRPYAPGYQNAWSANRGVVDLPYVEGEVRQMQPFDYQRLQDGTSGPASDEG